MIHVRSHPMKIFHNMDSAGTQAVLPLADTIGNRKGSAESGSGINYYIFMF